MLKNEKKGWCHESVGQAKGKDKIIVQIVNSTIPIADFIEYFLNRPISLTSSITQDTIDHRQFDEMINNETLYKDTIRQNIHQNSYIRRIVCQKLPEKQLKGKMERKIYERSIMKENFRPCHKQCKYEFSRCEQVYLTDIFISLYLNNMPEKRVERLKKSGNIFW